MPILTKMLSVVPSRLLLHASRIVFERSAWRGTFMRGFVDRIALSLRNRDGVIMSGLGQGLRFNVGTSRASFMLGTSKSELQKVMAALIEPGMVIYDIGANVGFHSCLAARLVGPSGHLICAEPLPDNCASIRRNFSMNQFVNYRLFDRAIGRIDGVERFIVSKESTWGSLVTADAVVTEAVSEMSVRVSRLDSLVEEHDLPLPSWMKIDVEGSEVAVLDGASATISAARPIIVIELHDTNKAISAALRAANYTVASVESPADVETGHWNTNIIAVPAERRDLVERCSATLASIYASTQQSS